MQSFSRFRYLVFRNMTDIKHSFCSRNPTMEKLMPGPSTWVKFENIGSSLVRKKEKDDPWSSDSSQSLFCDQFFPVLCFKAWCNWWLSQSVNSWCKWKSTLLQVIWNLSIFFSFLLFIKCWASFYSWLNHQIFFSHRAQKWSHKQPGIWLRDKYIKL